VTGAGRETLAMDKRSGTQPRDRWLWAAVCGIMVVLPVFGISDYFMRLFNLSLIYLVAVLGLNFITGLAGQVSFAQASFFGLGAYVSALLATRLGMPFWLCLLCAAVFPITVALLIGAATLKLEGHYLALATIGLCLVISIVLLNLKSVTHGADGVRNIPPPMLLGHPFKGTVETYYLLLTIAALLLVIAARIKESRIGRAFLAIKANGVVADLMGIPTMRLKILAFVLSAVYGAIGGALLAHYQGYIEPLSFGFTESTKILTMLFIGGLGSVGGAALGAVLLTFLPEIFRFAGTYNFIVYSVLLILLIIYLPSGLAGIPWRRATEKRP
jgi:branched-chain amino acid transport system permease protein